MRRRALLTSTASALAGLAGCFAGDGPGTTPTTEPPTTAPPTATPTEVHTPTGTPAPGSDVHFRDLRVQYGYVGPNSPDSYGHHEPDVACLVATVAVGAGLAPEAFRLETANKAVEPGTEFRWYASSWGTDEVYRKGDVDGLLLFPIGDVAADAEVHLTWPGGEQPIPTELRDRLAAGPPSFEAGIDAPSTWSETDAPDVAVTVENTGDRRARFLGALNRTGPLVAYAPIQRVTTVVDPGGTVRVPIEDSWTKVREAQVGDGEVDVTYRLVHGGDQVNAEITLVE